MFRTPLETLVGSKLSVGKLTNALETAMVQGMLETDMVTDYPTINPLLSNGVEVESIPPFAHPIKIRDKLVVDLRQYRTKIEQRRNDAMLKEGPVGLILKQAALQELWNDDASYLFDLSDLPIYVYAHWIGESIARRMSLNAVDNRTVVIASAWFYACQFIDTELLRNKRLDEAALYSVVNRIARITYGTTEQVLEIVETMGHVNNMIEFAEAIKSLNILRLKDFNVGLLLTWVGNSWFDSVAAKEMVGIAIEYPPYFLGILHTAATENTYKRTPFAELALRVRRDDPIKRFDISLRGTLNTLKD